MRGMFVKKKLPLFGGAGAAAKMFNASTIISATTNQTGQHSRRPMPTYTTSPGATSFVTPPLPTDSTSTSSSELGTKAGNRDSNTVEREGQNLCL